ncbi:MAG: conjugative transfer signal peptidase TraF [Methylococcales bacterium]|nr:conjugative transfer signal peptidase TraF [Methylococcales bacterium]
MLQLTDDFKENLGVNRVMSRFTLLLLYTGSCVLAALVLLYLAGVKVNTTKSIPIGFCWAVNKPVEKGDYVMFCPPKNGVFDEAKERGYIGAGYCSGGYGYMMKKILAAKKDVVSVTNEGVTINHHLLPLSLPAKADNLERLMPAYRVNNLILADDEVLLMSDVSATSFDARYFGPVKLSQVETVIIPFITW